ncbi:MAG: hypothetical protein ABI367_11390 [Mucilaginibacter sp.]
MLETKKDKYRKARGGKARFLDVICVNCRQVLLLYQKDGDGNLLRCYLNRIFAPSNYEMLQNDAAIREPKDMPNLICSNCNEVIGVPMRHVDGRLAFRLRQGHFSKRKSKVGG